MMPVRTSASSPAKPGMLSGPAALPGLALVRVLCLSAALVVKAGPKDGGDRPALLVDGFAASKHIYIYIYTVYSL